MAQIPHNDNAQHWREVRESGNVWRSVLNKIQNSQSTQTKKKQIFFTHSCAVMRYKHPKLSPASTSRIWEKFCLSSAENTSNLNQGLQGQKAQISTNGLQSREPDFKRLSRRTQEISEICFPSNHSGNHRTFQIYQNTAQPEEINEPGPVRERHIWTECVTSSEGVGTEMFGRSRWAADK